jgi:Sec-independent protein secretion pathway component TatC
MTAVPMVGLYELSIYVSRLAYKMRPASEDEAETEEADEDED